MSLIPVHPTLSAGRSVANDVANDASEASEPELLRLAIEAAEEVERPGCLGCWLKGYPLWGKFDPISTWIFLGKWGWKHLLSSLGDCGILKLPCDHGNPDSLTGRIEAFLEHLSMPSPADTKVLTVETKAKGGMVYIVHVFFLDGIRTSRSDSLFFTEHLKWRLGFQTYCLFFFSTWLCFSTYKIPSISVSPMMSLFLPPQWKRWKQWWLWVQKHPSPKKITASHSSWIYPNLGQR